jgi:hypothetical protein
MGQLIPAPGPPAVQLRREGTRCHREGKGHRACDWALDHARLCRTSARSRNAQSSCPRNTATRAHALPERGASTPPHWSRPAAQEKAATEPDRPHSALKVPIWGGERLALLEWPRRSPHSPLGGPCRVPCGGFRVCRLPPARCASPPGGILLTEHGKSRPRRWGKEWPGRARLGLDAVLCW